MRSLPFLFRFAARRRINYAQVPDSGGRKCGRSSAPPTGPVLLSSAQQGAIKSNQRDDISAYISAGELDGVIKRTKFKLKINWNCGTGSAI